MKILLPTLIIILSNTYHLNAQFYAEPTKLDTIPRINLDRRVGVFIDKRNYPNRQELPEWYVEDFIKETILKLNKNRAGVTYENLAEDQYANSIETEMLSVKDSISGREAYVSIPKITDPPIDSSFDNFLLIQSLFFEGYQLKPDIKAIAAGLAFGAIGVLIYGEPLNTKSKGVVSYILYDNKNKEFKYYANVSIKSRVNRNKLGKILKKDAEIFANKVKVQFRSFYEEKK
jgi:hypothetical protein